MKRLNQAYRKGDAEAIGNLVRQWETSPFASGLPAPKGPAPALAAAVAHAEQRLAEARESDLARLMEQSFAASMHGPRPARRAAPDAEAALPLARKSPPSASR